MIDKAERQNLLEEIKEWFDATLLWDTNAPLFSYRDDVTTHYWFFNRDDKATEDVKQEIRRWLEDKGWQFSRQMIKSPHGLVEHVYLAPRIPVNLEVGYHATRRKSVASIKRLGLLPSEPGRQTTEGRLDCEGNSYVCEQLGTPQDAGNQPGGSAHWWRDHLTRHNRFQDRDWVIMRVEVGRVHGVRAYKDIWSASGIILDNVPSIAPDLVHLVYADPA